MTAHELDVEYDITESGIAPLSMRELLSLLPVPERDSLLDELLDTQLGYSEARGTHNLRAELASTYKGANPDNVLVTTGAIEANFLLFNVLLEAGDHVVAIHPAYQQLYSVPRALGCAVDLWRLRAEDRFQFDLERLADLVRPETKLIVINTPHNPTGAALTSADLAEVKRIADEVDAWILCDEAYRWLDLPGRDPLAPSAWELGERIVTTGTFSKPFGLPGLRIGWMVAPEEIAEQCWWMRDFITLSPGKLNDRLALLALEQRDELIQRTKKIVTENLATLERWLDEHSDLVSWAPPEGGLLALIAYRLDIPSMDLANRLANEYSVMLAPGSAFDQEYHLRIGLGQRPAIFSGGLERASACFADLQARGVNKRDE